jgi:hypothetical protein
MNKQYFTPESKEEKNTSTAYSELFAEVEEVRMKYTLLDEEAN